MHGHQLPCADKLNIKDSRSSRHRNGMIILHSAGDKTIPERASTHGEPLVRKDAVHGKLGNPTQHMQWAMSCPSHVPRSGTVSSKRHAESLRSAMIAKQALPNCDKRSPLLMMVEGLHQGLQLNGLHRQISHNSEHILVSGSKSHWPGFFDELRQCFRVGLFGFLPKAREAAQNWI